MFEGRDFSERMEVTSSYQSAGSFTAWNKTNALSKELSGGILKLSIDTLKETIQNVVSHRGNFESWRQKENCFYHPQEFVEYREFDSRLELKK